MKKKTAAILLMAMLALLILPACGAKSDLENTIPVKDYVSGCENAAEITQNLQNLDAVQLNGFDGEAYVSPVKLQATQDKPIDIRTPAAVYIKNKNGESGFLDSTLVGTAASLAEAKSFLYIVRSCGEAGDKGEEYHWYYYTVYLASPDYSIAFRVGDPELIGPDGFRTEDVKGKGKGTLSERKAGDQAFLDFLFGFLRFSPDGGEDTALTVETLAQLSEPSAETLYNALQAEGPDKQMLDSHKDKALAQTDGVVCLIYEDSASPEELTPASFMRVPSYIWTEKLSRRDQVMVDPVQAAQALRAGKPLYAVVDEICGLEFMASYSGGIKLYAEIILRSLIDLETGKVADWSVRYNTADAPATVSFWSYSNDEYGRAVYQFTHYGE